MSPDHVLSSSQALDSSSDRWRWRLRLGGLLLLLGGEAIWLGLCFDAESLASSRSLVVAVLGTILGGASSFLVTLVAASVIWGSKRWAEVVAILRTSAKPKSFRLKLLIHLSCFGGLFCASRNLFEVSQGQASAIVGWIIALTATVGSWMLLLGSWTVLRQLPFRLGGVVAGSLVVGTAAYAMGRFSQQLWGPLRSWTFALVAPLSRALVPAVWADPQSFTIGAGDFWVEIAPDCSGYEGLGLTLAFLTTFFWVFRARLRLPRVLLLTVPILVTVWLLNIVRIAVLVAIGIRVSADVALGSFHSYVGSLVVVSVNLAIMFTILRTRALLRDEGKPALLGENVAASYLLPFLSLVAVALVTATLSNAGSTTWYPVRIVVAFCVLCGYRHRVGTFLRQDAGFGVVPLPWIILVTILSTAAWLACIVPDKSWSAPSVFLPADSLGLGAKVAWWVLRSVGAVLVIPMVEELAFRGFVIRRLVSAHVESVNWVDITPFALVAQALLFGILHPQHLLGGSIAGLAFGWLGRHTRCGYAPVLAHALTNATLLALAAFTNHWDWL